MNAGRHLFTIARDWPATIDQDVEAFDARQTAISAMRIWARAIVADARGALPIEVGHRDLAEWHAAAQRYLDTHGDDDGEFEDLIGSLDRQINAPGYGPDDGPSWRDSDIAERREMGL